MLHSLNSKGDYKMITPSFSLTATERVLPKLALDFTTASLDPRVTFSRTTDATHPATYVNSSGYVTSATNDQPRFDYDPITLACKGLLIEESRTNVMTNSNDFSGWTSNGASVSASSVVSPDGTTNATLITGASGNLRIYKLLSGLSSTSTYSFSWFAKAGTSNTIAIDFVNVTNGPVFNFSTGTWGSSGAWVVSAQLLANGWYRLTASVACNTTSAGPGLRVASVGSTAHIYGFQMELGAFATSYIPTTTAALTRNADVAVMTGTNFSDWFNASEGSAVIQVLPSTISGTRPAVEFDDNTANETIVLRGVAADPQLYVVDGGAAQATLDAGTITANAAYRLAGAWKSSSFATAINGAASVSQLSGTYPTVTQARFGSDGTNYLNGWLQNFRYWPQRITNAETQAFSK